MFSATRVLVMHNGQFRDNPMRAKVRIMRPRYVVEVVLKRRVSPHVIVANELEALEPALGQLMDHLSHTESLRKEDDQRPGHSSKGK